ncbi:hypothetical protein H102_02322 [Trichophyton rubrum CBS 100081]|nr:hypothetical protein H100_02326 [Trichophyton rubrum MR850]EZF44365.1 hypothetical protein H102_02322 [Trichophyton rubrum CBS 100081]
MEVADRSCWSCEVDEEEDEVRSRSSEHDIFTSHVSDRAQQHPDPEQRRTVVQLAVRQGKEKKNMKMAQRRMGSTARRIAPSCSTGTRAAPNEFMALLSNWPAPPPALGSLGSIEPGPRGGGRLSALIDYGGELKYDTLRASFLVQ